MQNKPNLMDTQMNVTKVLTREYENINLHRCAENKPDQTQLQTQANGFFKILPRLPIITRIPPGHWLACPIIQPAKDAEPLAVLVNLPLNPADKKNWSHPQARGARKDMPDCRRFLLENVETRDSKKVKFIKGLTDG